MSKKCKDIHDYWLDKAFKVLVLKYDFMGNYELEHSLRVVYTFKCVADSWSQGVIKKLKVRQVLWGQALITEVVTICWSYADMK